MSAFAAEPPAAHPESGARTGLALAILAAGASTRLGACKALVSLGGRTALERLATEARAATDAPLVVTGTHHGAIAAAVSAGPAALAALEVVLNPDWSAGRSGSVRRAAQARPGRDLLVAPIDVPCVPAAVFAALAEAWLRRGAPARGWLAPRCAGRFGHPIAIGRALLAELDALAPDTPLRALRARAQPLFAIDVAAPEVLDDLDTPADLERLQRRLDAGS